MAPALVPLKRQFQSLRTPKKTEPSEILQVPDRLTVHVTTPANCKRAKEHVNAAAAWLKAPRGAGPLIANTRLKWQATGPRKLISNYMPCFRGFLDLFSQQNCGNSHQPQTLHLWLPMQELEAGGLTTDIKGHPHASSEAAAHKNSSEAAAHKNSSISGGWRASMRDFLA